MLRPNPELSPYQGIHYTAGTINGAAKSPVGLRDSKARKLKTREEAEIKKENKGHLMPLHLKKCIVSLNLNEQLPLRIQNTLKENLK